MWRGGGEEAGELLVSQLPSNSPATSTTTVVLLMQVGFGKDRQAMESQSFIHMTIKWEVVVRWWRRGWGAVNISALLNLCSSHLYHYNWVAVASEF